LPQTVQVLRGDTCKTYTWEKTSTWSWSNEHTTWRAFPREETAAFPNEETVAFPREKAVDTTRPGITAICTTILPLMATYEKMLEKRKLKLT